MVKRVETLFNHFLRLKRDVKHDVILYTLFVHKLVNQVELLKFLPVPFYFSSTIKHYFNLFYQKIQKKFFPFNSGKNPFPTDITITGRKKNNAIHQFNWSLISHVIGKKPGKASREVKRKLFLSTISLPVLLLRQ